jgi:hypothetical protein
MAGKEMTEKSVRTRPRGKPIDGKLVNIFIWDAETCEQIGPPIRGLQRREVRNLKFSNDGSHLMTVGAGDIKTMGIYKV